MITNTIGTTGEMTFLSLQMLDQQVLVITFVEVLMHFLGTLQIIIINQEDVGAKMLTFANMGSQKTMLSQVKSVIFLLFGNSLEQDILTIL